MSLRDWSLMRVALVSTLWALVILCLVGWRVFNAFRGTSSSGSILGAAAGISDLLKLAALLLFPPAALFVTWLLQRRRA
jgi:hypothetical protein